MTHPNILAVLLLTLPLLHACGRNEPTPPAEAALAPATTPGAETSALIPLDVMKNSDIQTAEAGPADIRQTLTLYGRVATNAERVSAVRARFPGIVRSVTKAQGDVVKPGAVLATIESDESLQTYPLTAPIGGVITMRHANIGERGGEEPLFVITDISSLWAELSVFPRDRARIRPGQVVRVRAADGGLEAEAKLAHLDLVGGSNQAVTARAALDNTGSRWTPGLYIVADVVVDQSAAAVTIPRSALQFVENRETAFVQTPEGFVPRELKLGRRDAERVEVLEGITAGEMVAHRNTYLLASELAKPEPEE